MSKKGKEKLCNLYSEKKSVNPHKTHMDFLFPAKGCINFGYWNKTSNPITEEERLNSQKALYQKIFDKLSPIKGKTMLEVGCGRGLALSWLHKMGAFITGLDAFEEHVKIAQENCPDLKEKIIQGKSEKLLFPEENFDAIFSLEAAQHFTSFLSFIHEAHKVLKPNGKLVISTYFLTEEKYRAEVRKFIPDTIEGTDKVISIKEAKSALVDNQFNIIEAESIGKKVFPSFAQYQKQVFQENKQFFIPDKHPEWKPYFTGGGDGPHPWLTCFENYWIDYFIIVAQK